MKVLAVSHSCVVDVNRALYRELAAQPDTEVTVLAPSSWTSDVTLKPVGLKDGMEDGVRLLSGDVVFAGNGTLHFYRKGLRSALRASSPEVLLLDEEPWTLSAFQVARLAARSRVRLLFRTAANQARAYPPPFSWIQALVIKQSVAALVVSEEVSEVLRRKGFEGPIHLLPYGVDTTRFHRQASPVRQAMGLSGFVFGYVGRLVPEKGLDTLLEAMGRLLQRAGTESARLFLLGDGLLRPQVARRVEGPPLQGRVILNGAVPHAEVPLYLNAMDALVLPSRTTPRWKEQFGRVLIEAWACGIPVIGSDSGEIPRLISKASGGLIFKERDAGDLAEKMWRILTDRVLREQSARQGERFAHEQYAVRVLAAHLARLLRQMG